jgi:hypothetical protein
MMNQAIETRGPTAPTNGFLRPAEASRFFTSAKTGKPVHPSAVLRYGLNGVPSRKGSGRIYLAMLRHPSGWVTTEAAIQEFIERLTQDRRIDTPTGAPAPVSRRKAVEAAERELDRLGI